MKLPGEFFSFADGGEAITQIGDEPINRSGRNIAAIVFEKLGRSLSTQRHLAV